VAYHVQQLVPVGRNAVGQLQPRNIRVQAEKLIRFGQGTSKQTKS
jgi:hypothetical protein